MSDLTGIEFASDEAAEKAIALGLDSEQFVGREASGVHGFTVADVDEIEKEHREAVEEAVEENGAPIPTKWKGLDFWKCPQCVYCRPNEGDVKAHIYHRHVLGGR